jgi:1-acyl-sn-glycerol-3-phosphate acyltransferase
MNQPIAFTPPARHWTEAVAARLLVALTRLVTGAQARWVGVAPAAPNGPAQRVFFANHSSHLDALVLWAALPPELRAQTRPVAAADYWDRPGLRGWIARNLLNAVLVDRSGAKGGREALARLTAALAEGASLILFPEGTRGDGVSIGELKPGLYFVAKERPDVELVPVYLQNLCRILPKGEILPVPLLSSSTFGPPLHIEHGEGREAFLERARHALIALRGQP